MTVSGFPQIQAYGTADLLRWFWSVLGGNDYTGKENQRGTVSEGAVAVAPSDPIRPTAL